MFPKNGEKKQGGFPGVFFFFFSVFNAQGEMLQMTDACMAVPVVPPQTVAAGATLTFPVRCSGGRRWGRLVKLAEFSAKMRCFKGAKMGSFQIYTWNSKQPV